MIQVANVGIGICGQEGMQVSPHQPAAPPCPSSLITCPPLSTRLSCPATLPFPGSNT